jgi:hypothetical protein
MPSAGTAILKYWDDHLAGASRTRDLVVCSAIHPFNDEMAKRSQSIHYDDLGTGLVAR